MLFVKMEENVFPCVVEMVMRFKNIYIVYLFIWLHEALVVTQHLPCIMWDLSLLCMDSLVVAKGLSSCSTWPA